MAYLSFAIEELFFVRWLAGVAEDLDEIIAAVTQHRAELGREITYVSIQDTSTERPDEVFARRLLALAPDLLDQITHLYLVVAARGFEGSLHRRVITAGLAAARKIDPDRAGKVTLVDSITAALDHAGVAAARRPGITAGLEQYGISAPGQTRSIVVD